MTEDQFVNGASAFMASLSRTAQGTIDTSASKEKAEVMAVSNGGEAKMTANDNFERVMRVLFRAKDRGFATPLEALDFVDSVAREVNLGIVKDGQLHRTHDTAKYPYVRIEHIAVARQQFAEEFICRLEASVDPIDTAAWVYFRMQRDHFYTDGVGRVASALANWVSLRGGYGALSPLDRSTLMAGMNMDRVPPNPTEPSSYYGAAFTAVTRVFQEAAAPGGRTST